MIKWDHKKVHFTKIWHWVFIYFFLSLSMVLRKCFVKRSCLPFNNFIFPASLLTMLTASRNIILLRACVVGLLCYAYIIFLSTCVNVLCSTVCTLAKSTICNNISAWSCFHAYEIMFISLITNWAINCSYRTLIIYITKHFSCYEN